MMSIGSPNTNYYQCYEVVFPNSDEMDHHDESDHAAANLPIPEPSSYYKGQDYEIMLHEEIDLNELYYADDVSSLPVQSTDEVATPASPLITIYPGEHLQLLGSIQYPLFVMRPRDDCIHIHNILVEIIPPEEPNEFDVAVKLECSNNVCDHNEIMLTENIWYELYDVRVESMFKDFFSTKIWNDKKLKFHLCANLYVEFNHSVFYGNTVMICYDQRNITVKDHESQRIMHLAPLINQHARVLRHLNFSYFYYASVENTAEGVRRQKNVSNESILFSAELSCGNYSTLNLKDRGGLNSPILLEIIKLYPSKFIDVVHCHMQPNQQAPAMSWPAIHETSTDVP